MNFLRGSRRPKDRTTTTCRSTRLKSSNQRRFRTSIKKKKHKPNCTNQLLKNASSPQNSYVSDDAFSDACSENYYDLYASGTFDLNAAAHGSSCSDSSLAQQESVFSDSSHEEDERIDTILITTSGEEHGIFLDVGKEMVGSPQEGTTIVGKVPPSENGVCIKGNNTPSYLSVSVARGMSSLLSLCSSEEDAFIELISTNSFSPSSSSFEDLYYKEQDNTSDSSCSCSLSSRSPRYWDGHQDDKVQTQVNSSLARTIEEGSSSILLRMTGISSGTGGIIKKPYNVEDSNNGILVNHLALHDSSNTKNMPYDSRDDDEEENDRTLDEFEEPRIPPPNFPSVLPPQYSLLYEGRGCFNEDGNYIDDITEKGISNQSLSRNPKRISQRIRCFQVKKLMREKNKHSSNKEDFTSYMPLLENASVTPMNFQKHELIVSPLAKKLKSVNTQTTKAAWDYPWNDVVVKELQAPRRSTPKDNGSATDTPDVISESITKSAFSQTRAKSPPLSCFLTIDEKEEEHGSSARTHGTISVSKTVVDPSDHKLHDGKEEIITTVPNLVNFVSSSSLVLDQHSDDFPTRTSRIDCHRYEDNTMKELLSFHQHTKSRPGTFVMSPSAAGNKQATDVQLEKVVPERETCNMRKPFQGMVYQEILHDDRPTTRVKEGIMLKTTKSVSTQTSPTKQETFSSLLSILNLPVDVKDHLPSDSSSISSGCDSIFPRHDDIDKMMMSKRSDGGNNNNTVEISSFV